MNNLIALPSGTILNLSTLAYITSDPGLCKSRNATLLVVFCAGNATDAASCALDREDANYLCAALERQGLNVTSLRKTLS